MPHDRTPPMQPTTPTLDRRDWLVIAALLVVSRALYAALGLTFDASPFPSYMQFIDKELLGTRLLESLWYYHANPPLLNLFAGVGYKLFGEHIASYFAVVFHLLGALIAVSVYVLTCRVVESRRAAIVTTALLVFSPAFVLYENWVMYTLPSVALLTASGAALYWYVATGRTRWCATFFGLLGALLLLRSLFHLVWLLVIVGLALVTMWSRRKQIVLSAIVPVLLVVAWSGKNYVVFGRFAASSWLGLGLSNISTLVPKPAELQPLIDERRLSYWALVSRYGDVDQLFSFPVQRTGKPVLDDMLKSDGSYNFNNLHILFVDPYYTSDAITVVRMFPYYYSIGLYISNRLYFSPPNTNLYFSVSNRHAVRPMELIFNPLLYGASPTSGWIRQPSQGFSDRALLEVNTSIPLIIAWFVLLGYAYAQARRVFVPQDAAARARTIVIGFILVTALYLYVVGTAFELGENYRYRYNIEPLMFVIAASALTDLIRTVSKRRAERRIASAA